MSQPLVIILSILVLGGISGTVYAIIIKKFGIESFSIFRRELYDKEENDDDFYNRF